MEIITASITLPMTNGGPVVRNGAIAIELGKIHAFGDIEELKKRYPEAQVKSYPTSILMPGLVNAHCHLDLVSYYERSEPSEEIFGEQTEFIDNLISTIDHMQELDSKTVIDGIQKGINRLIETGVTCIGDMTHFEGTFRLLREMGLRAIVFPEILAGRGEAAQHSYEVALALYEKYTDATYDRVRVGLGPYAPYLLSRNLLRIISQHAKETSTPLMMHAAESFAEMEFFYDSQGSIATDVFPSLGWRELPPAHRKTPISYLADIGFFEAPTTIIGGLHLAGNDFSLMARNLVKVVFCPSMNKLMKHGSFPYGKYRDSGIPMGLGTESWHSHLGFNMWEEMRLATQRGATPLLKPKEALQLATVGSSRALGINHLVGTLQEGKKADYIILHASDVGKDTNDETIYSNLVMNTQPQHIKEVVVGGNILKST